MGSSATAYLVYGFMISGEDLSENTSVEEYDNLYDFFEDLVKGKNLSYLQSCNYQYGDEYDGVYFVCAKKTFRCDYYDGKLISLNDLNSEEIINSSHQSIAALRAKLALTEENAPIGWYLTANYG